MRRTTSPLPLGGRGAGGEGEGKGGARSTPTPHPPNNYKPITPIIQNHANHGSKTMTTPLSRSAGEGPGVRARGREGQEALQHHNPPNNYKPIMPIIQNHANHGSKTMTTPLSRSAGEGPGVRARGREGPAGLQHHNPPNNHKPIMPIIRHHAHHGSKKRRGGSRTAPTGPLSPSPARRERVGVRVPYGAIPSP